MAHIKRTYLRGERNPQTRSKGTPHPWAAIILIMHDLKLCWLDDWPCCRWTVGQSMKLCLQIRIIKMTSTSNSLRAFAAQKMATSVICSKLLDWEFGPWTVCCNGLVPQQLFTGRLVCSRIITRILVIIMYDDFNFQDDFRSCGHIWEQIFQFCSWCLNRNSR